MKKIKIFLGAYVNFANAQNINCDHIAKYLDKDKFEVHTMYTTMMPVDKKAYKAMGIKLHRLWHHRIVWILTKLWAMRKAKCDIYYLPKMERMDVSFAKKYKGKGKVFLSSVEGVVGEQIPADSIEQREYFTQVMDESFSISECVRQSVQNCWQYDSKVLYLGVDEVAYGLRQKTKVQNVVWVGSVSERKRPQLLLECAKAFPKLNFTIIGDGEKSLEIIERIRIEDIQNVRYLGRISNDKVYEELKNADLLLMTSDKEGLPKVIGEAMSSSLPAIYINECYTVDYIQDGVNGFGVANVEEMKEKLQYLLDNPAIYQEMSKQAFESIQKYRWSELIKEYEAYFERALEKYGKKE